MKEKVQSVSDNSIMYGYLIGLAIVMPWSNALFNLLLVSGILLFIIGAVRGSFQLSKSYISLPILMAMAIFFTSCLLSIIVRKDWDGTGYLNRIAVFTVLPFLVYNMAGKLSEKSSGRILLFYIHSTAILGFCTIMTSYFKWAFSDTDLSLGESMVYERLSYSLIHHQPIYFSLFVGFALVGLVYVVLKKTTLKKVYSWMYVAEILFLFVFLFLLGSRTAIMATLAALFVLAFFQSKRAFLILIVAGSVLFGLNYQYNDSFRTRTDHVLSFTTEFDYQKDWSYEGLALRYMTWNCSISCIKSNLWTGAGITDSQMCLDQCYKDNKYDSLLYFGEHQGTKYNSHNLFLDVLLKLGVPGLGAILLIFVLFMGYAFKQKNILMVVLIIFFCVNGLTESILVREKGIMFFSFMIGFLSSMVPLRSDDEKQKTE